MYAKNPSLRAALLLVPLFLISVWLKPVLVLGWALVYLAAVWTLAWKRAAERPWSLPLIPLAFLLHHLIYALGLGCGWLEGLLQGPGRLRRRLGRPGHS